MDEMTSKLTFMEFSEGYFDFKTSPLIGPCTAFQGTNR